MAEVDIKLRFDLYKTSQKQDSHQQLFTLGIHQKQETEKKTNYCITAPSFILTTKKQT